MSYYQDNKVVLHHGDCLDVLATLPDASVDAVVTDPPYGLSFMGKKWDKPTPRSDHGGKSMLGHVSANWHEKGTHSRGYADNDNVAFGAWCEQWVSECLRVLKPGGHLLAFGGTRTWHRLAVAVEDAGFEMRDSLAWLYGSGFPKSLDVSKAIDKRREEDRAPVDAVRSWLNERRVGAGFSHDAVNKHFGHASNGGGSSSAWMTNPTSRSLPTWDQWQELKSLFGFGDDMDAEVWRLNGRKGKPGDNFERREVLSERVSVVEGGSGGWSDMVASGRFKPGEKIIRETAPATPDAERWQGWGTALKPAFEPIVVGRKPLARTVAANVLEHGTGALNIDACRVGDGAESQGPRSLSESSGATRYTDRGAVNIAATPGPRGGSEKGRWPANVILDESQAEALDEQSGVTGGASRFMYVAKAPKSERPVVDGVAHPTVKPVSLMSWLVRLVTPPGGTVLEPFAGSGTTVEAAMREGFNVVAVEREADYLPLIMARIEREHARQAAEDANRTPSLFDEEAS